MVGYSRRRFQQAQILVDIDSSRRRFQQIWILVDVDSSRRRFQQMQILVDVDSSRYGFQQTQIIVKRRSLFVECFTKTFLLKLGRSRYSNNSSNNKLSNINTNKPFKLENIYKVLKPKPKPKMTLTTTIVLTRKTYTTITRIVPLKKQVKDAKTIAISPIASIEVDNIKPKTRYRARTVINCNVSRMLPPRPSLDFTQYIQSSLLPQ